MPPPNMPSWNASLNAMLQQQSGMGGAAGGSYRGGPSVGDRVVILAGTGYSSNPDANPIWGQNGEYIAGRIRDVDPQRGRMIITWDNGYDNQYDHGRANIIPLDQAPAPKKKAFGKKVEIDTTKLDALVIKSEVKMEVVALLQQHKHAKKLFEEWGLGEVIEYGRGMTLMFYGPPGTGKTFGAKCIAKSLGKELLVIGSAEIQSSEPGGANRAIQEAFKNADEENKVLFIDECDSLISNRANLGMILASEINTLLTEIEKCEGVVILATNRISDMDPALERRLSLIIEFPMPTEEQRVDIWKGLLPKKMPLNKDVIIEELAKKELSGGLIKNIVLQAARLAISDEAKEVAMDHFQRAIKRTTASQGLMGKDRIQHGDDGMGVGIGTKKEIVREKLSGFLDKK